LLLGGRTGGYAELSDAIVRISGNVTSLDDAPRHLRADAGDGTVELSWIAPSIAAEGYRIWRDEIALGDTTTVNFSDVPGQGSHLYRVATLRDGSEAGSARVPYTFTLRAPTAPRNVQAHALGLAPTEAARIVQLSWDAPATAGGTHLRGFSIVRTTDLGSEVIVVSSAWETTFTDKVSLVEGDAHYTVQAINALGAGDVSAPVASPVLSVVTG
jgi:hypothetical protein